MADMDVDPPAESSKPTKKQSKEKDESKKRFEVKKVSHFIRMTLALCPEPPYAAVECSLSVGLG
jgi:hypothetical protein